ncbi:aliphatic sulfonate ABC transporter substrate-binding protein [Derxia gummosa]|uniref:Putative aliphatic sulfonates-binding protein n=1 Tax=Derxia gummosa DSM 723 TaxID=1121388 RepID=A0A8B6X339_9BURK|nr:aliphatic sulfonate ABC transporter substrate-binding protein [Derxia gummosa]
MDRRHFHRLLLLAGAGLAGHGLPGGALAAPGRPEAAEASPEAIRVGFQKSSVHFVLLRQRRQLEQRFPSTRITWNEFPAGPQLLEALAVGSVDIGMTGDAPPVFAQASGRDIVYVGAEPPKPRASAILVRQDSPLRALADLKGRRIALQKGSSAHYLVLRAVKKAGLAWSDIEPIWLAPADGHAAFKRGAVDAWAIWDPYYAAAELDGGDESRPRVLHTGEGLSSNNSFYLSSSSFTQRFPAAVLALLDELTRADAWAQTDRKAATQLVADATGLPFGTAFRFLDRRPPAPVRPLTPELVADQQRVADAFAELGLIPRPVKVADIVWKPAGRGAA